jgi:hypothetical protein
VLYHLSYSVSPALTFWSTWFQQSFPRWRWTAWRYLKALRPKSRSCILAMVCCKAGKLSLDPQPDCFPQPSTPTGRGTAGWENLIARRPAGRVPQLSPFASAELSALLAPPTLWCIWSLLPLGKQGPCEADRNLPGSQTVKLPGANSSYQYTKMQSFNRERSPEADNWPFHRWPQLVFLNLSNAEDQAQYPEHVSKCMATEPEPHSSGEYGE